MKKFLISVLLVLLIGTSCTPIQKDFDEDSENEAIDNVEGTKKEETDKDDVSIDSPNKEAAANGNTPLNNGDNSDTPGKDNDGKQNAETDKQEPDDKSKVDNQSPRIAAEFSDDRWIIKPSYSFDSLETFGMSGYSIYTKNGNYGILDMSANGIGTGDYSKLFYCPSHGLSCPDILDTPIKMREDLYLAPDCGYEYSRESEVVYVFDPTRDKVYATGYSDGIFKIMDITDTEFFKSKERHTVVLYDCDADIMMYEGIGMPDINAIFTSEAKPMHYGVIDSDMDYVIACIYDEVRDGNDCYIVKKDGKYGYRAISGREYYPCAFEYANTAYKGAAWVKYGGLWGTVRF